MTTGRTRESFLKLSWEEQKATDFRKVFDADTDADLTANCIDVYHKDDRASMVIYANAVYCFGCKMRWWPDRFLQALGSRSLLTERGARKQPAPKFIPLAVADTYKRWLWGLAESGYYRDRQDWLLKRGLSREICTDNFIGHTGEAYSIPIFDGPTVRSIRYRRDDELASEDRPKYWGTAGANQAMLYRPRSSMGHLNFKYGTLLCEGELDALRLAQAGYPAVSLTNGCNAIRSEHSAELAALGKRVTVVYDQDEPGVAAGLRARRLLEAHGLQVRQLLWDLKWGKDVTEYMKTDQYGLAKLLERTWQYDS